MIIQLSYCLSFVELDNGGEDILSIEHCVYEITKKLAIGKYYQNDTLTCMSMTGYLKELVRKLIYMSCKKVEHWTTTALLFCTSIPKLISGICVVFTTK